MRLAKCSLCEGPFGLCGDRRCSTKLNDTKPGGVMGNGEKDNALRDASPIDLCICTKELDGCLCSEPASRTFDTGATRDTEHGKYDYEGFLSPLVLERYAEYMDKHRTQRDGTLRSSDNWQKGIPVTAYMKSKWRHFMETWRLHRTDDLLPDYNYQLEESLCAELFNTMGFLYEVIARQKG